MKSFIQSLFIIFSDVVHANNPEYLITLPTTYQEMNFTSTTLNSYVIALAAFTSVEFWPSTSIIKSATVAKTTYMLTKSNERIKINEKSLFKLDEAGFLIN